MQKQTEQNRGGHPWCTQYPMCLSATWWMPSRPAFSGFASTMFQMASLTLPNPLEMLNLRRCTGLGSTFRGTSRRGAEPLVELDAVLHPSVRRLIQDHLKDHIARGDLEKAGAPHLSLPKTLAPFAAISSTCHTLLFLNHFPRADTAQNQATLHAPHPGGEEPAHSGHPNPGERQSGYSPAPFITIEGDDGKDYDAERKPPITVNNVVSVAKIT